MTKEKVIKSPEGYNLNGSGGEKIKKRVEKRPPNEVEINAQINYLSNGVFKSLSDAPFHLWVEHPDPEKQITTFSYRGIDFPGYTFDIPWIEVQGPSLKENEEVPSLPQ